MSVKERLEAVPVRAWIVAAWFILFSVLFAIVSAWYIVALLFPIYWMVYLKRDLAPKWWDD